jgi:osmotically-inducible protein OsmY
MCNSVLDLAKRFALLTGSVLIAVTALQITANATPLTGLKREVIGEIERYYQDPVLEVRVDKPGVVTIEGTVDSFWRKRRVTELVSRVNGVRVIKNLITVNADVMPDAVIKNNIEYNLRLNEMVLEPEKIRVGVNEGTVILRGTVSFPDEKAAAAEIASWQRGVRGVDDEIEILPATTALTDANLDKVLDDVVERFFPLESHVKTHVESGWATLDGQVRNLWAKEAIGHEALGLRGIYGVTNNLTVAEQ